MNEVLKRFAKVCELLLAFDAVVVTVRDELGLLPENTRLSLQIQYCMSHTLGGIPRS